MNRAAPARRSLTAPHTVLPAPRSAPRPRIRIVRNLRVLIAAPARSPRCRADAERVAARLIPLPRVTVLRSGEEPVWALPPGHADRALSADADVLYICAHSFPVSQPAGFLDTWLEDLRGPLTAKALFLDTCWGTAPAIRQTLAALRPADLPPLALLGSNVQAPFTHSVLAAPLLEALLAGPRTGPWHQRLAAAKNTTLAGAELAPHALRHWARWQIHPVPGTARPTPQEQQA